MRSGFCAFLGKVAVPSLHPYTKGGSSLAPFPAPGLSRENSAEAPEREFPADCKPLYVWGSQLFHYLYNKKHVVWLPHGFRQFLKMVADVILPLLCGRPAT